MVSRRNLARSIMVSAACIMAVSVLCVSAVSYFLNRNNILHEVDSKCLMAVQALERSLPADYHDRIRDGASVSPESYGEIVRQNDDLCRASDLQYLWSVLVLDASNIVFTSATSRM